MRNLIICLLLISALSIKAQESTKHKTYKIKEIEVTDSRSGLNINDLGKQVEIITQEEISKMPVSSVDELLRYMPGIEIQSRGMFGTQADISMRGGTYNQTLILLDGVRIGDPMTGHFNSNLPISLSAIRRIEVIKGSSSSIYGADAVGGVINIVTYGMNNFDDLKTPEIYSNFTYQDTSSNGRKQTLLGLTVGDYSTYQLTAFLPVVNENLYYDVNYTYSGSYGYPAFNNTHNYGFDIHTGGASVNYKFNENDFIALRLAADIRDFDARYYYTASPLDKSNEKVSRYYGQTKLKIGSFTNHTIIANLGLIYTEDNFVFNPAFVGNSNLTYGGDFNLQDRIAISKSSKLTIGSEVQIDKIESNDRGNRSQKQLGVYAVGMHDFSDDFNVNLGLRGEYLPTENWEFVPSIGANYYISDDIKLRANLGKSVRTADYTERYTSTGLSGVLAEGRNLGNPDLLPEISWNYELGTDISLLPNIKLSVTGYQRDSKNIIDYGFKKGSEIKNNRNLNPDFNYLYAQNIASLKVTGLEFKLNGNMADNGFNWYLGGSILDISVGDSISSKYITNAAGINFSAGLTYAIFNNLTFSADAIYRNRDVSEAQSIEFGLSDKYFVMDGKLTYSWQALSFDLIAKNIFDEQYSDILGVQLPGRWLMLGVRVTDSIFR